MTRAELEGEIETLLRESGLDYDDLLLTLNRLTEQFEREAEDQG
jgi:hypothetical protein